MLKPCSFNSYYQKVICHLYKKNDRMEAMWCLGDFKLLKRNKVPPWFCHFGNSMAPSNLKAGFIQLYVGSQAFKIKSYNICIPFIGWTQNLCTGLYDTSTWDRYAIWRSSYRYKFCFDSGILTLHKFLELGHDAKYGFWRTQKNKSVKIRSSNYDMIAVNHTSFQKLPFSLIFLSKTQNLKNANISNFPCCCNWLNFSI